MFSGSTRAEAVLCFIRSISRVRASRVRASRVRASRVRGCRKGSSSQKDVEGLQPSLPFCSRGPFLPHPLSPLSSRVRSRRSGSSSQSAAEDFQSSLLLRCRGPLLTTLPHTLTKRKRLAFPQLSLFQISFNLEEKDMKKSLFGFVGYAYTIRVPCELSVNFS